MRKCAADLALPPVSETFQRLDSCHPWDSIDYTSPVYSLCHFMKALYWGYLILIIDFCASLITLSLNSQPLVS